MGFSNKLFYTLHVLVHCLVNAYLRVLHEPEGLIDVLLGYHIAEPHLSQGLGKADDAEQSPWSGVGVALLVVVLLLLSLLDVPAGNELVQGLVDGGFLLLCQGNKRPDKVLIKRREIALRGLVVLVHIPNVSGQQLILDLVRLV